MLIWAHEKITQKALKKSLLNDGKEQDKKYSKKVKFVCRANSDSDIYGHSNKYQHFTDIPMQESLVFIKSAQKIVVDEFLAGTKEQNEETSKPHYYMALYALGRLSHLIQDFYAHTNWINLAGKRKRAWNENFDSPNINNHKLLKNCCSQGEVSSRLLNLISMNKTFYEAAYLSPEIEGKKIPHALLNKDYKGSIASKIFKKIEAKSGFKVACMDAKQHTKNKLEEIFAQLKQTLGSEYPLFVEKISGFEPNKEERKALWPKLRQKFDELTFPQTTKERSKDVII